MRNVVEIRGLKELDARLGELSKSTARRTLQRVLVKAGAPIAEAARAVVQRDTGELHDSIKVYARVKNTIGAAEYSEVLRGGGTRDEAQAALRAARKAAAGTGSFAEVLVGPSKARTKADGIKRYALEFGSVKARPYPYMRPAWEQEKHQALQIIRDELGNEIDKTVARIAKRNAAKAAKAALAVAP